MQLSLCTAAVQHDLALHVYMCVCMCVCVCVCVCVVVCAHACMHSQVCQRFGVISLLSFFLSSVHLRVLSICTGLADM